MKVIANYSGVETKPTLIFDQPQIDRFWFSVAIKAREDLCWPWLRIKNRGTIQQKATLV